MLSLYSYDGNSGQYVQFSYDGDLSNNIRAVVNGVDGGSVIKKLFIRNDEAAYYYTNITVGFTPSELVNPANTRKIKYKLLSGDTEPDNSTWDSVASGDSLTYTNTVKSRKIDNIGSAGNPDLNYYPLWLRIDVPPRSPMRVLLDVDVYIDSTVNPV